MGDLSNKQKKEYALVLYTNQGLTQKEIAVKVGATEATISKWKEQGKWDNLKANLSVTKAQQLQDVYAQINELNTTIRSRKVGERFATSAESDTLSKLSATARNLETETSLAETINVFVGFTDWLRRVDIEKTKEWVQLQDSYIKSRMK